MSSTNLTGNPAGPYVGVASCVDAGFPVTSVSIKVPVQAMLDDAAHIFAKVVESGGKHAFPFSAFAHSTGSTSSTWEFWTNVWTQASTTPPIDYVLCPLFLPDGCTITSVDVCVSGGGGHSTDPANKLYAEIRKYGVAGQTSIGSSPDATAYPAYDSPHSFEIPSLSEVVDNTVSGYMVFLRGEYGMDSAVGAQAFACIVHFTPDT